VELFKQKALFLVMLLVFSSVLVLAPILTSAGVVRLYCDSTVVTAGLESTSHTLCHVSDDAWYQVNTTKVGPNDVIDVQMIYSTAVDPSTITKIYVFTEAHKYSCVANPAMKIFNYATGLWELCFEITTLTDSTYSYTITANQANYVSATGEMKLQAYYLKKLAPNVVYQDHTYIELTTAVGPTPPVASFTYSPTTPFTSETVTFNASASYDPDGWIVGYAWNFGDGNTGSGVIATHAYVENGTYTVTLNVTDNDGLSNTVSKSITVLNRPPVAIFTESATSAPTGTVIHFNASDSYDPDGWIVSYAWNFGDGFTGTGVTIDHAYADNGTYTVTLTVTDNDGATGLVTHTKTISNRPPEASFTESAETVLTGVSIHFDASASYDPDGTIDSYSWGFGDGNTGTGMTIDHSYADNGTYTVTLTVTDNDGATDTATSTKTILNRPPVASFTESATTVPTGTVIHFNASASYDPDGSIVSYAWDFGDGFTGAGVTVDHAYADNGTYTVTLTVTDNDGASASTNATKTIQNRPPVAIFTESAETVLTGVVIHFNASGSYDPDGTIVSYFWDFGDGNTGAGVTIDHSYADNGTYTVTLTVTDNDGETGIASSLKTVLNRPPVALFTESATTAYVTEVIYFNASTSYDPDGVIVSYFWDFGDGTNTTGVTTSHSYAENGTYTVTLTVTDNDGASDFTSSIKTILITGQSPVADFTWLPTIPLVGQLVTFDASISSPNGGSIVWYYWDFGDLTPPVNTTNPVTTHTYSVYGTYPVNLTIMDSEGLSDTTVKGVKIYAPPVADFDYSPKPPIVGETVTFDASASNDPDGVIVWYYWDFGDLTAPVNTTDSVATHTFSGVGNFNVTLTVADNDDLIDTASKILVLIQYPVADFTWSPPNPLMGQLVTFDASASTPDGGSIVWYYWDFGDLTSPVNTTDTATTHTYSAYGTYSVNLTIMDSEGLSDDAVKSITVIAYPKANFTYSPERPRVGELVTFDASASTPEGGTIISYEWDFGDTFTGSGMIVDHAYAAVGVYNVTLTVTDSEGLSDTTSKLVTVLGYPKADFTYSPVLPLENETVTFDASASTPDGGSIVWYYWEFDDGSLPVNTTDTVTTHGFGHYGVYNVTLTVMDSEGLTDSESKFVTVIDYPIARFTYSSKRGPEPIPPLAGFNTTFDASASTPEGGTIISYEWDFGDGFTGSGMIVNHTYAETGVYNVTLRVTDSEGLSDEEWKVDLVTVYVHDVAVVSITWVPSIPEALWVYPTGWTVNITATVRNEGNFTESFMVLAYYNTSFIGSKSVTGLASGGEETVQFVWVLTTLVNPGNYTIRVGASVVPDETQTADNVLSDGVVNVRLPGDVSGDGFVNAVDFGILGAAWFKSRGELGYEWGVDFDESEFIDGVDFGILSAYWFHSWPP